MGELFLTWDSMALILTFSSLTKNMHEWHSNITFRTTDLRIDMYEPRINTYLSLVTSYEDTDIAYQKIMAKRSKFIEFFRGTLYNREEFLHYLCMVVDRKQGQGRHIFLML